MSNDDRQPAESGIAADKHVRTSTEQRRGLFEIPPSLKRIFDKFPLTTYPANDLPLRAPTSETRAVLHIFTTEQDAPSGRPSFNPGCLKWQAYLKFCNITFQVTPSNNHASPSGALPFLQPATKEGESTTIPDLVPSTKLKKWIGGQTPTKSKSEEEVDERYDTYSALIEGRLRKAWVYQLYLALQNSSLVNQLYIEPCSRMPLVQYTIARQLRAAAEAELVKSCRENTVSADDLIQDAEEAFRALSTLLGEDEWFFAQQQPGMLDASLFAYTRLILGGSFQWEYNPVGECLRRHSNLVQHSERIDKMYF